MKRKEISREAFEEIIAQKLGSAKARFLVEIFDKTNDFKDKITCLIKKRTPKDKSIVMEGDLVYELSSLVIWSLLYWLSKEKKLKLLRNLIKDVKKGVWGLEF